MNANFNRQFILIDFRLLDNKEFLDFMGTSEFATYLILRRYIWRDGNTEHYMGLNKLYRDGQKLACSLDRDKLSDISHIAPDNISRHLSRLEKRGMIKRIKTGRQNIYILGEWFDASEQQDGSYKVEWFYMERQFGIPESDLTKSSGLTRRSASDQRRRLPSGLTRRSASDNNREINREENNININVEKNYNKAKTKIQNWVRGELNKEKGEIDYLTEHLVEKLGDANSRSYYRIVARKVPTDVIFRLLSETFQDGQPRKPAAVFTSKVKQWLSKHRG